MKPITIILSIILFFAAPNIFAEEPAPSNNPGGNLKLVLTGFDNNKGMAMVALCHSKENFDSGNCGNFPSMMVSTPIKNERVEHIFQDIPFGKYAIRSYHDENGNGELDANFMGIPKEDYGFSNNARGMTGPPKYEKVKFSFHKDNQEMEVEMK